MQIRLIAVNSAGRRDSEIWEVVKTREYELRLRGTSSPDGQILVNDLLGIGEAMKTLVYRLTREAADRPGLGRADAVLESLSELRVQTAPGSTRLLFLVGDANSLEVDPLADTVDAEFWAIVSGLSRNQRRGEVTNTVAEATADLVGALKKAAPEVDIALSGRPPVTVITAELDPGPWRRHLIATPVDENVHGTLEMVDLHTARFRLRDAVGNAVDLIDVQAPSAAAHLVGGLVTARGELVRGTGAGHHRLHRAVVTQQIPIDHRLGLTQDPARSLEQLVAAAHALDAVEPMDLSAEEIEEFLAEIRG